MHKLRQSGMIAVVLGMMSIVSAPALAQDMSNGADNFYKSRNVTMQKVWYQEWGQPTRELHAGDVANIPPETKHWHGAAKDSWFSHVAVGVPADGGSTEWLEPVPDEEYKRLP